MGTLDGRLLKSYHYKDLHALHFGILLCCEIFTFQVEQFKAMGSPSLSCFSSSTMLSWESFCCLGCIVIVLIEPWTWVEHYGSIFGLLKERFKIEPLDWNRLGVTKIVLLELKSVPLTSRFIDLTWGSDSVHLSRLRQSKASFHQALDLILELDGGSGQMCSGHLEAKCSNFCCQVEGEIKILHDVVRTSGYRCGVLQSFLVEIIKKGNE
uniref:Uncharacterized protein n=1 Tax=Tanacetum cinerariifolium TaxID=118510 RepID=A0A6L2NMR8_TANCI|nr:hypothetical protein [Tanacetum cinerariifolium]